MDTTTEPLIGDAFGSALLAHLRGEDGDHVLERDDGFVETMSAAGYFAPVEAWPDIERRALAEARGSILDAGAGAGRAALACQDRGDDVVAIDTSPGAVVVCRERGVRSCVLTSVADPGDALPARSFDTILLLGHNLGILGSALDAEVMFAAMDHLLTREGRVLGIGLDPYVDALPHHLDYHERNRARSRLPGQIRLRTRHRRLADPWFDWLFASLDELADLADRSRWEVVDHSDPDPAYLVELRPSRTA